MAEQQLRRALSSSQSDWTTLDSTPLSASGHRGAGALVPLILRPHGEGQVLTQIAGDSD